MGLMEGYESIFNNGASQGSSTPSWFGNIGSPIIRGVGSGMDFLNDNSKGLGAGASLWGAYNQYNMGNQMMNLQKDAYAYNKALSEREKKRQEDAEKQMQYGFSNSGLGTGA